jgi:hypothetical protein
MLLQSHKEGLYVWNASEEEAAAAMDAEAGGGAAGQEAAADGGGEVQEGAQDADAAPEAAQMEQAAEAAAAAAAAQGGAAGQEGAAAGAAAALQPYPTRWADWEPADWAAYGAYTGMPALEFGEGGEVANVHAVLDYQEKQQTQLIALLKEAQAARLADGGNWEQLRIIEQETTAHATAWVAAMRRMMPRYGPMKLAEHLATHMARLRLLTESPHQLAACSWQTVAYVHYEQLLQHYPLPLPQVRRLQGTALWLVIRIALHRRSLVICRVGLHSYGAPPRAPTCPAAHDPPVCQMPVAHSTA